MLVLEGGSSLLTPAEVELAIDNVSMATGSLWLVGSAGVTVTLDGSVGSQGTINIPGFDGGGLTVTGNFSSEGTGILNMFDGSLLTVQGPLPVHLFGDTNIVGQVGITADTVEVNVGTVELVDSGFVPTVLTVNGDLELDGGTLLFDTLNGDVNVNGNFSVFIATIIMNIEFASGDSNQIFVSGTVSLGTGGPGGPTLVLNPVDQFVFPTFFDLIFAGAGSGDFNSFSDEPSSHGWVLIDGILRYRVIFE